MPYVMTLSRAEWVRILKWYETDVSLTDATDDEIASRIGEMIGYDRSAEYANEDGD